MRMAATAAVYNRLHNTSVGVVGGGIGSGGSGVGSGGHHHQLARSLERILEEAHLSGELILTNRKLKDFPKTGTKYNLNDTVIADLSRNRFCELPEEITSFSFLETLLLYHNTIRSIPESVKHLTSLTYLDLRSNQLSTLPRELCFLPLQVLLVSNNRLVALPDELGRMDRLTDLDASYNQLSALPARIGELRSLRSFSLRSNQLMYLPRELTCLTLVSLDVSNNRISSLPLEIRQMTTLVELNLENNPMTSPPASLCVRGLVHVFKYLETQATKDEKGSRAGGNYDGYTTLRRAPRNNAGGNVVDTHRIGRHHVDSGYSTCDGIDKRWSHDMPLKPKTESPKHITPTTPPLPKASLINADLMDASLTSSTSTIVDETINMTAAVVKPLNGDLSADQEHSPEVVKHKEDIISMTMAHQHLNYGGDNHSLSSTGSSPDLDDGMIDHHQQQQQQQVSQQNSKIDDKFNKNLGNIQTYREYKEALKQQRSQEVYKIKEQKHLYESNDQQSNTGVNPVCPNTPPPSDDVEIRLNGNAQSAIVPKSIIKNSANNTNGLNNSTTSGEDPVVVPKKPIQKVIPSRNTELMSLAKNDILSGAGVTTNGDCIGYVKPSSPMKTLNGGGNCAIGVSGVGVGILTNNNKFTTSTATTALGANKMVTAKAHRSVTWNHDIPPEKLSFTMRREFDRQREEIELMTQLRSIIETRLKMTLPEDIASALTDGVILCHLANYVRPRSVASIHVPSPGVSKLTMARCRRNVDNFLEACRRIGVDEELLCSCEDVIPSSDAERNEDHANDIVDNGGRHPSNKNYHEHNDEVVHNGTNQYKVVPNPAAVLKTVTALIALDTNPHHQNIKNLQQQQEFHSKLLKYHRLQKQPPRPLAEHEYFHAKKSDWGVKRHCVLLEESEDMEEYFQTDVRPESNILPDEQNTKTATCTKEQMMRDCEKSDSDKFEGYDSNLNEELKVNNDADSNKFGCCRKDNQSQSFSSDDIYAEKSYKVPTSVENFYRHYKLKTYQKIKLNLITHHGNNACVKDPDSDLGANSTLQTIEETENDIISGGAGQGSISSGLYHIVDEKYNNELSLKVFSSLNEMAATPKSNKYQLMELACPADKTPNEKTCAPANTVSKRIEFFEHANIPNGGIIKPKSNIYSIYRVSDSSVLPEEKLLAKDLVQEKEAGSCKKSGSSFLLRHDSHTLTIILSCVFIVTFLLLVFFPIPG